MDYPGPPRALQHPLAFLGTFAAATGAAAGDPAAAAAQEVRIAITVEISKSYDGPLCSLQCLKDECRCKSVG